MTWEAILAQVSKATGVPVEEIKGNGRTARVAEARHIAMFIAHQSGLNYSEISRLAQRDHSTVRDSVQLVEFWRGNDRRIQAHLERIENAK